MKALQVSVTLNDFDPHQKWPDLSVYVFNRQGRLLARQPLAQDAPNATSGHATIEIRAEREPLLVKMGPTVKDVAELDHYSPMGKTVMPTIEPEAKLDMALDPAIWRCWLLVRYLVRGTVVKSSATGTRPICTGEVEIFEVDLEHCFIRLPDPIIERLRDAVIDLIVDPMPVRMPELPEWLFWDETIGVGPLVPGRPMQADIQKMIRKLPREWAMAGSRLAGLDKARDRMTGRLNALPIAERQALLSREAVEGVKINDVLYSNTAQFRNLVLDKFQAFRYWFCWYPWIYWLWWPFCWGYSLHSLGKVSLQSDGTFADTVWLSACDKDIPDLWFVVRQEIDGATRVIYARHPVPCNTYWNHPSGKPVRLVVTDPLAIACPAHNPPAGPDDYVMPFGIGNDYWYQIQQAHFKTGMTVDPNRGLYNPTSPAGTGTDPYGTRLDLLMQFGEGLRAAGVHYYRWSYRTEGAPDWIRLNNPIVHRYLTIIAGHPAIVPYQLGPTDVAGGESGLFEVPDPALLWIDGNVDDRAFAVWNTALYNGSTGLYDRQVLDGHCELYLEMFDNNGHKVMPASAPSVPPGVGTAAFKFYLPTGALSGGVWPVDDAPEFTDGGVVFRVHVDNAYTVADIQSVGLGGVPATDCQFLEYDDPPGDVQITYAAYHPNGFLEHYDLAVYRGISGTLVGGPITSSTPADPAATQNFPVTTLLSRGPSTPPYTQCSFSANLHTYPRTRNGYDRIRAYEAWDVSAFALTPSS